MTTIVCHGDSLTEGADLSSNSTWPLLVENQVKVRIINSGIGGDTSGGLLGRFYHDVVRHKPEMVLIMGGTNDLWWDLDINLIQANIFAMTCQAEFHNITPIVGLPLPLQMESIQEQDMMAPIAGWPRCVQKLAELAAALESAARASDIALLDFYHLFQDQNGAPIAEYYLPDGLHPNKQGHQRMSEKAVELLCSQFYFQNK